MTKSHILVAVYPVIDCFSGLYLLLSGHTKTARTSFSVFAIFPKNKLHQIHDSHTLSMPCAVLHIHYTTEAVRRRFSECYNSGFIRSRV